MKTGDFFHRPWNRTEYALGVFYDDNRRYAGEQYHPVHGYRPIARGACRLEMGGFYTMLIKVPTP